MGKQLFLGRLCRNHYHFEVYFKNLFMECIPNTLGSLCTCCNGSKQNLDMALIEDLLNSEILLPVHCKTSCGEKSFKSPWFVTLSTKIECHIKINMHLFATLLMITIIEIIYSSKFYLVLQPLLYIISFIAWNCHTDIVLLGKYTD